MVALIVMDNNFKNAMDKNGINYKVPRHEYSGRTKGIHYLNVINYNLFGTLPKSNIDNTKKYYVVTAEENHFINNTLKKRSLE